MNINENCPRIEALSALVDNELAEQERAALDAHVANCPVCAPMLSELRQLHGAFAALPEVASGVDIGALVNRRLPPRIAAKPQPRRWRWWQLAPAAFGGAVSLSLGAYLGSTLMLGTQVAAHPAAQQMAAFTASPPGALCPALQACNPNGR